MTIDSPKASTHSSTFRMDCAIRATIQASPDRVWALLTDAAGYARWNSTVESLQGEIAEGQTLQLRVPGQNRVFKPRVCDVKPGRSMIWRDGMAPMFKGVRTFTLTPNSDGSTDFFMQEGLAGLMLPLIKGSLPDFAPVFETYAGDLKRAAEER